MVAEAVSPPAHPATAPKARAQPDRAKRATSRRARRARRRRAATPISDPKLDPVRRDGDRIGTMTGEVDRIVERVLPGAEYAAAQAVNVHSDPVPLRVLADDEPDRWGRGRLGDDNGGWNGDGHGASGVHAIRQRTAPVSWTRTHKGSSGSLRLPHKCPIRILAKFTGCRRCLLALQATNPLP